MILQVIGKRHPGASDQHGITGMSRRRADAEGQRRLDDAGDSVRLETTIRHGVVETYFNGKNMR